MTKFNADGRIVMSLGLHALQKIVFKDAHRFRVVAAGRRWGKTRTAKTEIVAAAVKKSKQLVWYVGPTYAQAPGSRARNNDGTLVFVGVTAVIVADLMTNDFKQTPSVVVPVSP